MDPDSTAGTSDCLPLSSDKCNNGEEDYISKLLDFDDYSATELPPSTGVVKTMPNDTMKINNDPVTPEETSEIKVTNGHSHTSNDESFDDNDEHVHHSIVGNGFSLAQKLKDLMLMQKEGNNLREKWEQTEKEKNSLQFQVELLQAENLQFKHMKSQREENSQKLNELQKDLASKSKAQLKLRNEIESCNLQISEKNDAIKKMKKDNKSLWNMVTRFARKLSNADLLTAKEKNIMKKYGEENQISMGTFDSEDQSEDKDSSSLLPKNTMDVNEKQNKDLVENENTTHYKDNSKNSKVKNDGFQFSQSNTPLPKPKLSSGANYFMKSCRDVIEDPHVSDDCLDVTVNELKELRRQLSASKDHFSPISPLPPTPPPTSNKFRPGLSRRGLAVNNQVLTVPVCKNPNETPLASKSQVLHSANSSVPNSARKLTFCHQQSEGFEAPSENSAQRFNSDTGVNFSHNDNNTIPQTNFSAVPYKFSAKRYHDGSIKFNFHINNPISLTVDPNNWEVSCILGQHDVEITNTPFALQPQSETANMETCESFNNDLVGSEKSEHAMRKISKFEPTSLPELTTPILKSSEQSRFVSVGKPNAFNHDMSVNNNSFDCLSKETALQKEIPLYHPHVNMNDNKTLDAFANLPGNNVSQHPVENPADDNRSLVSSSCESPSPYRKKNESYSQEFLSPSHNSTSVVSAKRKKLGNLSNRSKMGSSSVPEVNSHLKYDSSGSESELTVKSKLTKPKLANSAPVKKRRKSSLMASVESSNVIPARNKGRTLLSRAFSSTKNSINADANLEVKKTESSNDEIKTATDLPESDSKIVKDTQFNSSCNSNDPSNSMKLVKQFVEENENSGEPMQMQQEDILYENVKSKKRVSRIDTKKSETTTINHPTKVKQNESLVGFSSKKRAKRERKIELKKMAALKNRASEWAAQRMKGDIKENEHVTAKEPFDSNLSTSNAILDSLIKHNTEISVNAVFPKTEKQHEIISVISDEKPKERDIFPYDSLNIPVESCAEIQSQDVSVKIINDNLLNVPSSDDSLHNESEEKSNTLEPESSDGSFSKNVQFGMLLNTPAVDNNPNDSEPALASNQCSMYADAVFPSIQMIQQNSNTSISDADNFEFAAIQSTMLCKLNSPEKTNHFNKNEAHTSPKSGSKDYIYPIFSPSLKPSKTAIKIISLGSSPLKVKSPGSSAVEIKSPSESPTRANSSVLNSFSSINNSEVNSDFPEVNLPPLPMDPFGLSGNKHDAFSNKKTCIDGKLDEFPKIGNLLETVNKAKTNLNTLFNKEEFGNGSFIDLLVRDDVEDSVTKIILDDHNKDNFSSNTGVTIDNSINKTGVTEVKDSLASGVVSGGIVLSASSSFDNASNVYSNVDMVIDSVVNGGITEVKESQVSYQTVGGDIVPSGPSTFDLLSNNYSNIDMIIDSVAVGGIEVEVQTQDLPPRACRKRQSSNVDSSHQADKKKTKGGLKSINLSIAKESALSKSDTSLTNRQFSEADSDTESTLIIAEDFEEVQHSNPILAVENSKENVADSVKKNTPNKTTDKKQKPSTKTPKKMENKTEIPDIEAIFQVIDRIKFTETHFRLHVHNLMTVLINPSVLESTPQLVFRLIKYLHTTRKNPMLSFSLSNDPNTLLSTSEQCIVQALVAVDAKNKPHLSGLLTYIVETIYELVLGKGQYHIYGLSSLCRVMAAICKELKDPSKPRSLCCDVLKYSHKFAPFLIASIVGIYREAFEVLPDTTEEEKIFLGALSYGVQRKPKTLTETQWKHCNNVFSKYLTVEILTNVSETLPYLMSVIEDKCLSGPYENEYMLMGSLVIYARVNGWSWAQEHLLEDYVLPNLDAYCEEEDGERAFSFFTELCADICYGCPDKELSRSWLMKYWRLTGESEFVQIHAGAALLKLILLRKELFPDEMQDWIPHYHEDPRVVETSNIYFRRRLMEDQELDLQNGVVF